MIDKLDAAEVEPGSTLVVNARQTMAFDSLPPADSLSHLRFLDKAPVPDVVVERDIGAPPACIAELTTPNPQLSTDQ